MSTMNETVKRKCHVVATAWEVLGDNPEWEAIIKHFDLGFPYAWLIYSQMGTLNKRGIEQVEATYDFLLKAMSVEESEDFYGFWDVMAASNKGE